MPDNPRTPADPGADQTGVVIPINLDDLGEGDIKPMRDTAARLGKNVIEVGIIEDEIAERG